MRGRVGHGDIGCERLGDAEVEQFHHAVAADENVRWFQVPMHDQIAMRIDHGCAHLFHQCQTGAQSQRVLVAIARDRLAFDEFQREVRCSVVRDAAIVKLCDVRMLQTGQHTAFVHEPFAHGRVDQFRAH